MLAALTADLLILRPTITYMRLMMHRKHPPAAASGTA
jgi:hypothetical protein